jgi:hypothetical protein
VTKRKRVAKVDMTKRVNHTRHFRAVLIPKVKELLAILQNGWALLGHLERGQYIDELISLGCSRRGLGRELGVSETTIRRHAEIAELPESDRKAIESGASAKKILTMKAIAERQRHAQQQIDQDTKTGALSDKVATTILEFCRLGKKLRKEPMIRGVFPMLLDKVESDLRDFEANGHRAVKVSKKLESLELFRKTRPRAAKSIPAVVRQAEWLAEVLWLIAPESPIRASGILKARRRASELLGMTLIELYVDAELNRRAKIIELYNPLPRKSCPEGARSLQRQGRASPPAGPKGVRNTDSRP